MKTVQGTPRINAVYIGEIQLDLLSYPDIHMTATIGFVETVTSRRYGSFNKMGGWSQKTLQALNAFIEALEEDAANDVFVDGAASPGGQEPAPATSDGVPGL